MRNEVQLWAPKLHPFAERRCVLLLTVFDWSIHLLLRQLFSRTSAIVCCCPLAINRNRQLLFRAYRRDAHPVAVSFEVKVDPDSVPGIGDVGTHAITPKVRESDNVAVASEADGRGDVVRQLIAVAV